MVRQSHGAIGAVLLAVVLLAIAGLFDAEPLYVPGVALALLGIAGALWAWLGARGLRVERSLAAASVQEGDPLPVRIEVRAGRVPPPAGELRDPLLASPAALGVARRRTSVRIQARFARRGRRVLAPPSVLVTDPLGLAGLAVTADIPPDEVLVLPRVEPVQAAAGAGGRSPAAGALGVAGADADLDGLRAHRPGAPATRIAWPIYARSGELHERSLRPAGDTLPLIVLDLGGTADTEACDAAARAAASLAVLLAGRGGCALLLPGDRRPVVIDEGLRGWARAHARLALVPPGARPQLAALAGRRGALVWVAARGLTAPPAALARAGAATRFLVVPGALAGRAPAFTVAGCTGYALKRRDGGRRPGRRSGAGVAG